MLDPPQGIMSEHTLWCCLITSVNFEHLPESIFIEGGGRKTKQNKQTKYAFNVAVGNLCKNVVMNRMMNDYKPSNAKHEMYHFIKIY